MGKQPVLMRTEQENADRPRQYALFLPRYEQQSGNSSCTKMGLGNLANKQHDCKSSLIFYCSFFIVIVQ